jgi:hypothetical protein
MAVEPVQVATQAFNVVMEKTFVSLGGIPQARLSGWGYQLVGLVPAGGFANEDQMRVPVGTL